MSGVVPTASREQAYKQKGGQAFLRQINTDEMVCTSLIQETNRGCQ